MDMAVRTAILLGCLLASCLTKACSKGSLGNDAGHDSNDALSDDAGHDPDVSHDPDSMDLDAEGELDADAFEPHEVDCILPVRDCGSGCRQVTCAAPVYFEPRSWDIYRSKISYYSLTREYGSNFYFKDLGLDSEKEMFKYPDLYHLTTTVSVFEDRKLHRDPTPSPQV